MGSLLKNHILFIAGIWTILATAFSVQQSTDSWLLAGLVLLVTLALAIGLTFPALMIYMNNIRSGYRIYRTPSFQTVRKTRINIDHNFFPIIEIARDYVFLETPKEDELIDMFDTLEGQKFELSNYHSPDSTISAYTSFKPNVIAIQWQPKKPIFPLVPYRHKTTNTSPSVYGPDYFYHSVYFDREVGLVDVMVLAPQPLAEVCAFIMPQCRRQVTERILYAGMTSGKMPCAQPTLSIDGRKVCWKFSRPKLGKIYVLLGIYEGGRDDFLRKVHSQRPFATIQTKIETAIAHRSSRSRNA